MEKPNKTKREIVKMLLNREIDAQDEEALLDLLVDQPISIDVDKQEESKMSFYSTIHLIFNYLDSFKYCFTE